MRSGDDFGRVACSFNSMAVALHESRRQTEELLQTLETKVQECTRELLAARAEVVQDTVRMVDSQASLQKVRIVCELDAALPLIWVDADLIKQVVMNLLVNAQQAIVGSGVVTVQTRLCADASHPQQEAQPAMVELTVSDSIPGIHSESGLRHFGKKLPLYVSLLQRFALALRIAVEQLERACARGDWALGRRVIHTIKGNALNLGASDCGQLCHGAAKRQRTRWSACKPCCAAAMPSPMPFV